MNEVLTYTAINLGILAILSGIFIYMIQDLKADLVRRIDKMDVKLDGFYQELRTRIEARK